MDNATIRTRPRPECPTCSSSGQVLYEEWVDRILGLPGSWRWKQCNDKRCGTLWQDPVTVDEDLWKLYINYPTHEGGQEGTKSRGFAQHLRDAVRNEYLYTRYGYASSSPRWLRPFLASIAYLHPAWRDTQAASVFYLPAVPGGTVLDVGCGNGSSLRALEQRGWRGIGVDFDPVAVDVARSLGTDARVGELESQKFPEGFFDAIIMSHVIEHVPCAKALLQECRRILKEGGVLIAITPNAASRGHQKYCKDWRGFEPDHLQIFTPQALKALGAETGFSSVRSFSSLQGVDYLLDASEGLMRYGHPEPPTRTGLYEKLAKQLRWFVLGWLHILHPGRDEVAVLSCKK
ncbi:MAG TPA: class I SAM-dependent methyltransferase [Candidatus Paceibacterota bacterium]